MHLHNNTLIHLRFNFRTDFRTIVKDLEQRAAQFKDVSQTKSTNTYQVK